jgi:transcriptional/translational regulatory protein YebC/TACO1
MDESDSLLLGGNIELVGFRELDSGTMIILKKMIGNHVRRLSNVAERFEKITVSMKKVGSGNNKFEVQAKLLDNGKAYASEVTDFNIFFTTDKVMSNIQSQLSR